MVPKTNRFGDEAPSQGTAEAAEVIRNVLHQGHGLVQGVLPDFLPQKIKAMAKAQLQREVSLVLQRILVRQETANRNVSSFSNSPSGVFTSL